MNKSKFYLKFYIIAFIIILVCLCIILLFTKTQTSKYDKSIPSVIYIAGWGNVKQSSAEELTIIQKIFPKSNIQHEPWANMGDFEDCIQNADEAAMQLAYKISHLTKAQRENIILIGHSLGGRIAIKTMALLKQKNMMIRQGIFIAAAIPDNDPNIALAINNSKVTNINIYNRQDYILRHIYGTLGEDLQNALGSYGYGRPYKKIFLNEIEINEKVNQSSLVDEYLKKLENHSSIRYLNYLQDFIIKQSSKLQAKYSIWWYEKVKQTNYKLEYHFFLNKARIVDCYKRICFIGTKDKVFLFWQQINSINKTSSNEFIRNVKVIQDLQNPPIKIIDLTWDTIENFQNWKLQKKDTIFNDTLYRIVDPKDYQKASGSHTKMYESFKNIKKQLKNE